MSNNIEVKIRGLLDENQYKNLIEFLDKNGSGREEDNRKTTFFVMPEKTLKITEKVTKGTAKIALKMGDIVKDSSQTEFEVEINPKEFDLAEEIFYHLGFTQIQHTNKKRINYQYKNCEFAVKWSIDWSYHFKIEKMVNSEVLVTQANIELLELAQELNLSVMNEEEFGKRCAEIDAKYNPPK